MTPSIITWRAHGEPKVSECAEARGACWLCGGETARGMPLAKWMPKTFTDHQRARLPSSQVICEACVWVTAGRPPDTLRMQSHLLDERGWLRLNKGDKAQMRNWLRGPKSGIWFAAIADSGKKHCVPYAPLNPPGSGAGRVFFEEQTVSLPADWSMLDAMTQLLTDGATKGEISAGEYGTNAWRLAEVQIRSFEHKFSRFRGGGWFTLAIWLAQRDEVAVQERIEKEKNERANSKGRNGKRPSGAIQGVHADSGSHGAEALAAVSVGAGDQPDGSRDDRAVAGEHPKPAQDLVATQQPQQLTLFGTGAARGNTRRRVL